MAMNIEYSHKYLPYMSDEIVSGISAQSHDAHAHNIDDYDAIDSWEEMTEVDTGCIYDHDWDDNGVCLPSR